MENNTEKKDWVKPEMSELPVTGGPVPALTEASFNGSLS